MIPASMKVAPVPAKRAAIRRAVAGEIALHSATAGLAPVRRIAAAASSAKRSAAAGGRMERRRSAVSTRASSDSAISIPAVSASLRERSPRPVRQVTTRKPRATSSRPTPEPMSPGL